MLLTPSAECLIRRGHDRQDRLKQIREYLKPKKGRRELKERNSLSRRSIVPTLGEAKKTDEMIGQRHQRSKGRKREALFTLFQSNISMFCRLNKQKSQYKQYFKSKTHKKHHQSAFCNVVPLPQIKNLD